MSQLTSICIDFGSQRSVIAAALRGGSSAIEVQFQKFYWILQQILGIQGKQAFRIEELKWLTVLTSIHESGKTLFEVAYLGQKVNFTPEQLAGTMLNKLKHIIQLNDINIQSSNVCISVPAYYTESERKALIDVWKIADIPLERLLNETNAITINYWLFRKTDLDPEKPRNVVFVDLGHSNFSAFVGQFYKEKAQVLAQVCERNCGARDIDWDLFEKFVTQFEKQTEAAFSLTTIIQSFISYIYYQEFLNDNNYFWIYYIY